MRKWRSRWRVCAALLLVAWAVTSWPAVAEAAARVVAPDGWGESAAAAPEAQRRASRWQSALGLRLAQVLSAPEGDRFAETVAVFERGEPVPEDAFASEPAAVDALAIAVANVVGDEPPIRSELRSTAGGEQIVWARWIVDDLSYECVLAPSGDTTTIVIAAVLATDIEDHRTTLTAVFEQLDDVTAPMARFSLLGWRIGSVVLWLALALGMHAAMLQLADRDNDHGQAGIRASGINLGLVVIGTAIAAVILRGREAALIYSGSSVAGLAVWIGVAGLIVAGVHFLLASRLDRGQVQSAPASGAFASGIYSTADVIRSSSVSRSGMRRTPDELEQSSSNWPRPGGGASRSDGRIIIDEAERE
ncbi:MAG TPA: hypothetical protein VK034_12650 [Enhygromyxa sp.]|nr:hypothetical protein [Enhygromyxa sp.]